MQLSELFRRGVVRPLDEFAATQLAAKIIHRPIRVEWLPILNEHQFGEIWGSNILQQIGIACEIEIRDYEEIELVAGKIPVALKTIANHNLDLAEEAADFLRGLVHLLQAAASAQSSVYFVL